MRCHEACTAPEERGRPPKRIPALDLRLRKPCALTSIALAVFFSVAFQSPAGAQWTQTSSKASWFSQPGSPLLTPACESSTSGTTVSTTTLNCSASGFTAYGFAQATTSGALRSGTSFNLTEEGLSLNVDDAKGSAAYAFFGNKMALSPLIPGPATVSTISAWVKLDGKIAGSSGTWTGGSSLGPVHQNYANLHIWNPIDGFRDVFVDWTQVGTTTGAGTSLFIGDYSAPDKTCLDCIASADGWVLFSGIPVAANVFDFYMSLQTVALYGNWFSHTDLVYRQALSATGFENTAMLSGFQAFDAAGNDISSDYTFTLASGETVFGGDPRSLTIVTPEPASLTLFGSGLVLMGGLGFHRRRRRVKV